MKTTFLSLLAIAATVAVAATAVVAQDKMDHSKMDHSKMDHSKMGQSKPGEGAASDNAATKAFKSANDRMHGDMAITFSGNADVDFIKGMMPHHQGAIDMAKIELEHGKDPKVRKLAREIIKAQNTEIAFMKAWLAKNAK